MNDRLETDNAAHALTYRLRDWGVPDPAPKARSFIDDLAKRGWKPAFEISQRRPPRKDEECGKHPGEYAPPICRCCHADKRAARQVEDAAAEEQVRHTATEALAAARAAVRAHTNAAEDT